MFGVVSHGQFSMKIPQRQMSRKLSSLRCSTTFNEMNAKSTSESFDFTLQKWRLHMNFHREIVLEVLLCLQMG